jgi:hypothetical protein
LNKTRLLAAILDAKAGQTMAKQLNILRPLLNIIIALTKDIAGVYDTLSCWNTSGEVMTTR